MNNVRSVGRVFEMINFTLEPKAGLRLLNIQGQA